MNTKFFLVSLFLIGTFVFTGCNNCEGDEYGSELELLVPIETTTSSETMQIGDTLWVTASIDKDVMIKDRQLSIRLDSFNFFTQMIISEISDSTENFNIDFQAIEEVGEVDVLPLVTLLSYPLKYEEEENAYRFRAGVVFSEPGLYFIRFDTLPDLYERYEHPVMYRCENQRRTSTNVFYVNPATNPENYENVFLQTNVDYLLELMDYERYASIGSFTLRVER